MNKTVKIIVVSSCYVIAAVVAALCVLFSMGFKFSSKNAVHKMYHDKAQIHTDEYDFYLDEVTNSENGEVCYATGHIAVKKYGFLYKEAKKEQRVLVAENGDSVGKLVYYEGEGKFYNFIHWTMLIDGSVAPSEAADGDTVSAYTTMKYCADKITVDGEDKELYLYCYFVTDKAIAESLTVKDTTVFVVNGRDAGDYWNDDSVMVINTEKDIDEEKIKAHYDNGGIIVVRNTMLSEDVQSIVKEKVISERDEKDLAVIFYRNKNGVSGTSIIQGNTSDLEEEIDDAVKRAKAEQ